MCMHTYPILSGWVLCVCVGQVLCVHIDIYVCMYVCIRNCLPLTSHVKECQPKRAFSSSDQFLLEYQKDPVNRVLCYSIQESHVKSELQEEYTVAYSVEYIQHGEDNKCTLSFSLLQLERLIYGCTAMSRLDWDYCRFRPSLAPAGSSKALHVHTVRMVAGSWDGSRCTAAVWQCIDHFEHAEFTKRAYTCVYW